MSVSFGAVVGVLCAAIWIYLFFFRGGFWRVRQFDDDDAECSACGQFPPVVAIVPARNEVGTIGVTVAAILKQDYPGSLRVVVVDDHSSDGTADAAARAAAENNGASRPFAIYSATALPGGWTGKLWALNEGVGCASRGERADEEKDEFYWFTDADVQHVPDTLRRLVARAQVDKLDLASLMVLLRARAVPEKILIPAFLYFFLQLYPPKWIADSAAGTAGAAGGCLLIRREALQRIGGLAAIRDAMIDDCALARAVKLGSGKIWMGVTRASISLRDYESFTEIRDMIARTAFTQLRYSPLLLLITMVGLFLTYLAPLALLLIANVPARVFGMLCCCLMAASFFPSIRFYRLPAIWVLLLPVAAVFYAQATVLSAVRYWLGRGGQWKGRAQARSVS